MISVEVIEDFTLGRFGEIKNLKRAKRDEAGKLFKGDTFDCTKDLADYLIINNSLNRAFVKVLEIIPENPIKEDKVEISEKIKPDVKIEIKEKKKKPKKK